MSTASILIEEIRESRVTRSAKACWRNSKVHQYESLVSLNAKLLLWNCISERTLIELYTLRPDALRISELGRRPFSLRCFMELTALKRSSLAEAFASFYIGQLSEERLASFRSNKFRACPACMVEQYHSELYQMFFVPFCPIHQMRIEEAGRCLPGEVLRRYSAAGNITKCFAPSSSRIRSKDTNTWQTSAKWLHETVARPGLANYTIVPKRFFEPDSSVPLIRDADLKAKASALLQLWRTPKPSIPQLSRCKKTAQDGKTQFAVVDTREKSSDSIELSFFRIYRRVSDSLRNRHADRHGISPEELISRPHIFFWDTSHRALDFVLWRAFWEGAHSVQDLKRPQDLQPRQLSGVLEQGFLETFGSFAWIERRFGRPLLEWLFEQVLKWTFIERGRLIEWCRYRGLHIFSRLRGSMLPVLFIDEQQEELVVYYKLCPGARMLFGSCIQKYSIAEIDFWLDTAVIRRTARRLFHSEEAAEDSRMAHCF